jgi:hypothetical protein
VEPKLLDKFQIHSISVVMVGLVKFHQLLETPFTMPVAAAVVAL